MALTTSQLRTLWGPPCTGPWARIGLYGEGVVVVRASVIDAVRALDSCLVRYGYETRRADTGAYNCRPITGGVGYSLHAYAIALDLNWQTNPYGPRLVTDMPPEMVAAIKKIRTRSGAQVWRWGGDFAGNKDAMHFEVVATPSDIASGIDPASLPPTTAPAPPAAQEDDEMYFVKAQNLDGSFAIFHVYREPSGRLVKKHVTGSEWSVLRHRYESTLTDVPYPDLDMVPEAA